MTYWQGWSDPLKRSLKLATEPVAVTFAGPPPPDCEPPHGRVSVCQALRRASEGEPVTITAETCGCPGGLVSLGLGQLPPAGQERLSDFLVTREKVYASRMALHRSQQSLTAPVGVASRVVFSPLSTAGDLPDLVVFVGTPGSLHHLLGFAGFWEGGSIKAELVGPACRTGITYPVVTGEIGLSLFDFGARRLAGFGDDQLLVGVPFHRIVAIVHAFDRHGLGGTRDARPEQAEHDIDRLGPVEPVLQGRERH